MKIATWNVNSIRARLSHLLDWLESAAPDALLLQETKVEDEGFPRLEIEAAGYRVAFHGQKSYNGVAIISRQPVEDIKIGLPGDPNDAQARYIEATLDGIRLCGLYLPNGNPVESEKFPYKLAWMERLIARTRELIAADQPFLLGGDFNVIPSDFDVFDPKLFANDALTRPETRARFRALLHLGLTDSFRALHPDMPGYSFWDYQAGAWPRDQGLRIDHFLLSPQLADRLISCEIDRTPRGLEKASDHTPVVCTFSPSGH
jgi:exodeoxyribonuclease-3